MYFVRRIGSPACASIEKTTLPEWSADPLSEAWGNPVSRTWSAPQANVILLFLVM